MYNLATMRRLLVALMIAAGSCRSEQALPPYSELVSMTLDISRSLAGTGRPTGPMYVDVTSFLHGSRLFNDTVSAAEIDAEVQVPYRKASYDQAIRCEGNYPRSSCRVLNDGIYVRMDSIARDRKDVRVFLSIVSDIDFGPEKKLCGVESELLFRAVPEGWAYLGPNGRMIC